jgi:hypothetical protein
MPASGGIALVGLGEAEEGVLNVRIRPLGVAGDATSPINASAVIPLALQSTQLEVAG